MTNYYFMLTILWLTMMSILLMFMIYTIHPTIMIIMLMTYNIMMCLNLSFNKSMIIYPILFFLIMISGLLVIFLYFSSLISNEKNWLYMKNNLFMYMILTLMLFMLMKNTNYSMSSPSMNSKELMDMMNLNSLMTNWSSTNYMYMKPLVILTLMSMIYLLISMITIIKISLPKILTLRKLN